MEEAVLIQIKGADTLYISKEMTRKAEHLRKWRRYIREVSGASRWMKRKTEAPARLVSGAETRGGVIELIKEFWLEEWNRTEEEVADIRTTAEKGLVEPLRRHLEGKTPTGMDRGSDETRNAPGAQERKRRRKG